MGDVFRETTGATLRGFKSDLLGRRGKVEASLAACKNQDGPFAAAHHFVLAAYDAQLVTLENTLRDFERACETVAASRTTGHET